MVSKWFVADMFIYLQLNKLRNLDRVKLLYSRLFVISFVLPNHLFINKLVPFVVFTLIDELFLPLQQNV